MNTVKRSRMILAKYDAAQTTDENRRHWASADGLSANAAMQPAVRQVLRNRVRYEFANNSYCKGIATTLTNDVVGTGPRLQMLTENSKLNERIEEEFRDWAAASELADRLWVIHLGRIISGESFGLLGTNPLLETPVKLSLNLVEADQISSGYMAVPIDPLEDDGIVYDAYGNPQAYLLLPNHPGDLAYMPTLNPTPVPAQSVLHYYRPERPGQRRGIPDMTPAIQIFAEMRRYSSAVLAAAETAADYAAVLYTEAPADDEGEESEVKEMDTVELARRMATTLPAGYKLGQVHAEQPTTTYREFFESKIGEVARCMNIPFTIAALNSSNSNLSAAYLDHQTYAKEVLVNRSKLERLLDRLLDAWLTEAIRIDGLLPRRLPRRLPHSWFWPAIGQHADPAKVANAQETRLVSGTTTLAYEYAQSGRDWEAELRQRAKEVKLAKELGLPIKIGDTPDQPKKEDSEDENDQRPTVRRP